MAKFDPCSIFLFFFFTNCHTLKFLEVKCNPANKNTCRLNLCNSCAKLIIFSFCIILKVVPLNLEFFSFLFFFFFFHNFLFFPLPCFYLLRLKKLILQYLLKCYNCKFIVVLPFFITFLFVYFFFSLFFM